MTSLPQPRAIALPNPAEARSSANPVASTGLVHISTVTEDYIEALQARADRRLRRAVYIGQRVA